MDFQLYGYNEDPPNLTTLHSPRPKTSWNVVSSDGSMDSNDGYFTSWTGDLKIPGATALDEFAENDSAQKKSRKRRILSESLNIKKAHVVTAIKYLKDPLSLEETGSNLMAKESGNKREDLPNGSSRMPQWQVDDIAELNADLEGLGNELSNNSYNMSDAILSLPGLTVFKQEAPSPTSHDLAGRPNHQSPTSSHNSPNSNQITSLSDANNQNVINNAINHLLGTHNSSMVLGSPANGYGGLANGIENGNSSLLGSPNSQDGYRNQVSSSDISEDCRFQYVLAAATSIATKVTEDALTYLNQGQSYEIKLKKLGDLSAYKGKMLKSIIRICFHERRLQYMEKEQMSLWQSSRPGDRILEVDVPLSYGLCEVVQPQSALNTVHFQWDPTKEVGVYIKVNCISTEFTPKKHGGEKGVPFRIQVETYLPSESGISPPKCLHAAACQIKVFKLKGADRKHKQDREKILKRPLSEQEKFQPSYECTVMNDVSAPLKIPRETVCVSPTFTTPSGQYSPEIGNSVRPNVLQNQLMVQKLNETDPRLTNINQQASNLQNVVLNDQPQVDTSVKDGIPNSPLLPEADYQQTIKWLNVNRFGNYLQTFASFSGADMLRMSKEDFIEICGLPDGIRLYNALHSKAITPKLTIYVCRENAPVFQAIYLMTFNDMEFYQKLSNFIRVPRDQIGDFYIEGPQGIHILVNDDVLTHIKDESMFSVDIVQHSNRYVVVLKPIASK